MKKIKLCLDEIKVVDEISSDWFFKKNFTTKWGWNNLLKGDRGKNVEDLTFAYLDSKYENIESSGQCASWDFILKNEPSKKIEIRRVSSNNKGSEKVFLGFSGSKNVDWRKKSDILNEGGYLFVQILENKMSFHYLKAECLLNEIHKTKYFKNKVPISNLNILFPELEIPRRLKINVKNKTK
jgi:hypothetical protein